MDARATLSGGRSSTTRFPMTLIAAVIVALVVGWIGGYVIRGLAVATPTTNTITAPHPLVVGPAPYSPPTSSPMPEPTNDPSGIGISI
jgi:hypothetical protein